jgi:hypothetical protein
MHPFAPNAIVFQNLTIGAVAATLTIYNPNAAPMNITVTGTTGPGPGISIAPGATNTIVVTVPSQGVVTPLLAGGIKVESIIPFP